MQYADPTYRALAPTYQHLLGNKQGHRNKEPSKGRFGGPGNMQGNVTK